MRTQQFCLFIFLFVGAASAVVMPTGISDHPDATRAIILGDSTSACMDRRKQGSFRRQLWARLMKYPRTAGNTSEEEATTTKEEGGGEDNKPKRRTYAECVTLEGTPSAQLDESPGTPATVCHAMAFKKGWIMPPQYDAWWGRFATTIDQVVAPKYAKNLDPPLDVALVMGGINDFMINNETAASVHKTLRSIVRTLSSNTSRGFRGPTRVLLGTVLTQGKKQMKKAAWKGIAASQHRILDLNKLLRTYNGQFPALTDEEDGGPAPALPFTLVDVTTSEWKPDKLTLDGIHPNTRGENFIGDVFFDAFAPLIEERSYKCLGIPKPEPGKNSVPTPKPRPSTARRRGTAKSKQPSKVEVPEQQDSGDQNAEAEKRKEGTTAAPPLSVVDQQQPAGANQEAPGQNTGSISSGPSLTSVTLVGISLLVAVTLVRWGQG